MLVEIGKMEGGVGREGNSQTALFECSRALQSFVVQRQAGRQAGRNRNRTNKANRQWHF